MKPIKIAVCMKDPGYAGAVARGLAEQNLKSAVTVMESLPSEGLIGPLKKWQVLVTDLDRKTVQEAILGPQEGMQHGDTGREEWGISGVVLLDERPVSAEQLGRKILACLQEAGISGSRRRGRNGVNSERREPMTVAFYARWGGCGVTSASLVTGWILAGAYGERVLYLPFTGRDGSRVYRPGGFPGSDGSGRKAADGEERGARELLYRMRQGLSWIPEVYISTDDCGLDRLPGVEFLTSKERWELAFHLGAEAGYDWVLMDFGTENPDEAVRQAVCPQADWKVEVENFRDQRSACCDYTGEIGAGTFSADWTIRVLNRAPGWKDEGSPVIPEDEESFLREESSGLISVNLHKTFAMGVKKIAEILLEGESDFSDSRRLPSNDVELRRLAAGYDEL